MRLEPELFQEHSIFAFDLIEPLLREIGEIHFVHDHNELFNSEHAQQIRVTPALFFHSFVRRDHEDRRVRARRTGDHVLQKLFVTWRVDDDVRAPLRFEPDLGRIDRDVLTLLFEQRVEHKREFELHPLLRARFLHHLDLAFRQ